MWTNTRPHKLENLKKEAFLSLSVAKWSRLFKGKTEREKNPLRKRIFSANGNGLKNVFFFTTWEQKNIHIGCVCGCVCVCICIQTGDFNNRRTIGPGWGGVPGFILCTKPMRTSPKKTVQTTGEQWEVSNWRCLHMYLCGRVYDVGSCPLPTTQGNFLRKRTIEWTMRYPTIIICEDVCVCILSYWVGEDVKMPGASFIKLLSRDFCLSIFEQTTSQSVTICMKFWLVTRKACSAMFVH